MNLYAELPKEALSKTAVIFDGVSYSYASFFDASIHSPHRFAREVPSRLTGSASAACRGSTALQPCTPARKQAPCTCLFRQILNERRRRLVQRTYAYEYRVRQNIAADMSSRRRALKR